MTAYNPEPKDIDINSSAAELRNYTLAFVSFLLYVLITAASTTHEQLLRISAVKLPLLDIDIPIVQFYLVSPLLILILHFHLLLQHFLFSQQYYLFVEALKAEYPEREDRIRFMKSLSSNLSLVHLLGGYQKPLVQIFLAIIFTICLLIFPLFDLWFLQARFLPFHDNNYTNWQCLMVVTDCVMLLVLLPKTFDGHDNALRWWLSIFSLLWWLKRLYLYGLRRIYYFCYWHNSWKISKLAGQDKSAIRVKWKTLIPKYRAMLQIRIVSFKRVVAIFGILSFVTIISFLSVFVSTLPAFEDETKDNLFINDREKWLINHLKKCDFLNKYETEEDFYKNYKNNYGFLKYSNKFCKANVIVDYRNDRWSFLFTVLVHEINNPFVRSLDLDEKTLTTDEHLSYELENTLNKELTLEKISGINLKKRDLRYASFIAAKLPKLDLRKVNLQDANLRYAQLQAANLFDTKLQRARLKETQLQGSIFKNSILEFSNLSESNLQGSYLFYIKMKNADLSKSNLQGAYLFNIDLQNANLKNSELQGAYLYQPQLQGADLSNAQLNGTYFSKVEYSDYRNSKSKKFKPTIFLLESKLKWNIPCLTDDIKLPICKKYNPKDSKTLKKITAYWINNLACSDKWIAQGIMRNYLFNEENAVKFKTYLIPLLKKKLKDPDCTGIQNLPDDFKQQIKDAIKQ